MKKNTEKKQNYDFFMNHSVQMDRYLFFLQIFFVALVLCVFIFSTVPGNERFVRDDPRYYTLLIAVLAVQTAVIVTGIIKWGKSSSWYRYLSSAAMSLTVFFSAWFSTLDIVPFVVLPVILFVFYYDIRCVVVSSVIIFAARLAGLLLYAEDFHRLDFGLTGRSYNIGLLKTDTDILSSVLLGVVFVFCVIFTYRIRKKLDEELRIDQEQASMNREMLIAGSIQNSMLIRNFPDEKECSVYAVMKPAKEVGGDFYDYIKIGDSRIAIVIADVSGKGVRASLFMSMVKAIIRVYALEGNSSDKILEKTNAYITAEKNRELMFVTVWVGILDLKTGLLSYTNAGHNQPCIAPAGEKYEFLSSKVNFVVGGKSLVSYYENQMKLSPGDRLFLYTDGVTEARNAAGEFLTSGRMLLLLNGFAEQNAEGTVNAMLDALDEYVSGTDQYDDITMLSFEFRQYAVPECREEKVFEADAGKYREAEEYIKNVCDRIGCPEKVTREILMASSEVISNICLYAYAGKSGEYSVSANSDDSRVILTFSDSGAAYNLLENETPDITLGLKQRKPGGLGVFVVRKLMNEVHYRYENGKNILTLVKIFR